MKTETLLSTLGCAPELHRGVVNTPVYRASTVLFPTLEEFEAADRNESPHAVYGRYGTRSSEALEGAIAALEGADHAIVLSSGLAAIVLALTSFLRSGDHLLMTDNVYGPARRFCEHELKRFGVETTYYDPKDSANIASLIKDNTRVIYLESPGSLTFEMEDVPAVAKVAHSKGIIVMGDNTWATPLGIRPFELGMDVSIHSATKYISGHSDLIMGVVSCKKEHYTPLLRTFRNTGATPGSDNCFLALRGLRTLSVRLKQHYENGMAMAEWFKNRPEVEAVLHPALPGAPGHAIWKRDFSTACSLFGVVLKDVPPHDRLAAMLDHLELFGMGYSWGGYESLITPVNLTRARTASRFPYEGQLLRVHIGLENPDDLKADLEKGFERLKG